MTKVVPAIQPKTIEEYQQKLRVVRQLTSRFQLDVVGTDFNDEPTIELSGIAPSTGMECDVHIMARDPRPYIVAAKALYPHLLILQYEDIEGIDELLQDIHGGGQAVGVAINPETSVADIAHLVPILTHVLIMAYPAGPSGQPLQPAVLSKVAQIRELKPAVEVGLDGGVAENTLGVIAKADLDIVNVTTYLFSAEDPLSRYTQLMEGLSL